MPDLSPKPDAAVRPSVERRCAQIFYTWVAVRTIVWILLARLTESNASLDVIQLLLWGREWRWGYTNHPPLPAWLTEIFFHLTPGSLIGLYLCGYIAAALCLWSAWRLAREMLPPTQALWAALCLEGLVFFNYQPHEFNNNVALDAFWALATLGFYFALRTQRRRYYLATGAALAGAMLCKYTAVFLIIPMVLFWLSQGAASRRKPAKWLPGIALSVVLFSPHLEWMLSHDLSTIRYAVNRASSEHTHGWIQHLHNPLEFVISQALRLLPVAIILLPLLQSRRATASPEDRWNRRFLMAMALGPFSLYVLLSAGLGLTIRDAWGSSLWTFLGLLMLQQSHGKNGVPLVVPPALDRPRRWFMGGRPALRLAIVAAAFLVAGPGKNLLYPVVIGRPNRTDFPGKELAVAVAEQWERKYSEPLRLVAGDGWLAGNVACYHPGRPSVYDRKFDPTLDIRLRGMDWTSEEDLTRRGGVFLWDVRLIGDAPPEEFQRCFPQAQIQPPIELNYRCLGHVPPARIGVAVIPPAGHADRSDRIRPTAYSEMPAPTGGRPRNVIRSHGRRES